jgi:hypothetical protein
VTVVDIEDKASFSLTLYWKVKADPVSMIFCSFNFSGGTDLNNFC